MWKLLIDDSHLAASVARTAIMQKIPFKWHLSSSDEYIRQVEATEDVKKFDFIHMIQVLLAVEYVTYQRLIKNTLLSVDLKSHKIV